jgi:hypothetical protein
MSKIMVTGRDLFEKLNQIEWNKNKGKIEFAMANIKSTVKTTDIIGFILQNWIKDFFEEYNIYYREPSNTQSFPDFYLSEKDDENLLEIKTFYFDRTPAFDIANFESYCESISKKSYRLDADYLIFGYIIDENRLVEIKKIWFKKIWEISGISERYPLKTQVKRGMIYNIRPNTDFKYDRKGPFVHKEDFVEALYLTLEQYKGKKHANDWLNKSEENIKNLLSDYLDN